MFTKTIVALAFGAIAVTAMPGGGSGSPSTGAVCCQNVENSSDPGVADFLKALIGVDVSGLNVPIGTGCTPVSVLGGVSCDKNTVSCGQVFPVELIGINCVPVTVDA